MNYKEIKTNKYNLYHIKTDKFAINKTSIQFQIPFSGEKLSLLNVLTYYVARTNKKYKTTKDIYKEIEKRFLLNLSHGKSLNHSLLTFKLSASYPDSLYLGNENIENIFDFLFEIAFNASFEKTEYNLKQLELSKNKVIKNIQREKESKPSYANKRFNSLFYENTPYHFDPNGSINLIKEITIDSLLSFSNELFYDSQINIFVISNSDASITNKLIEKGIIKRNNKDIENNLIIAKNFNNKEVKEKIVANQSILKMAYVYDCLEEFESSAVALMFTEIFGGGGSSLLFQEVREKNSLCYHISASLKKYNKYILINSYISAINYEKTKDLISQELTKIKDGNLANDLIEAARITLINTYKTTIDSKSSLLTEYENKVHYDGLVSSEIIEMLEKVSKDDIIKFASSLKLSFIYFLEGVDKLEEN